MTEPVLHQSIGSIIDQLRWRNRVNDVANARITIDLPHHEVHEGDFYTLSGTLQINAGTANAFSYGIYPPTGANLHFQGVVSAQNSGYAQLWEQPSFTLGDTVTPFNNNRNSLNAIGGTFVTNPTIATLGTLLQTRFFGSNAPGVRIGGESNLRNEWILNPSYTYLLWVVADNASTNVNLDIETYKVTV